MIEEIASDTVRPDVVDYMWRVAAQAAHRTKAQEEMKIDGAFYDDALSAIILSAAATEAYINQLADTLKSVIQDPDGSKDWNEFGLTLEGMEKKSTKTKFEEASRLISGKKCDTTMHPFDDFLRLIAIRNACIHPKVVKSTFPAPTNRKPPDYAAWFANRGMTFYQKGKPTKHEFWPMGLFTPKIARWSCRTSANVILAMNKLLAAHTGYDKLPDAEFDVNFWQDHATDPRIQE